jgi:hypothetical protein
MTCKRFKRCVDFRLGRYECDHQGEGCTRFLKKNPDLNSPKMITEFQV